MYTVYVGGVEVNDYHLPKEEAERLYDTYVGEGYDDVEIVEVED
jgi:deoxyhypusine synthase